MSDKKHIDRLFQEKFKDFEVTPNDKVWENINARLQNKKKTRVVPFWWKFAGLAAAILLLFTIGSYLFKEDNAVDPIIVNEENSGKIQDIPNQQSTNPSNNNSVVNANNQVDDNSSHDSTPNANTNTKAVSSEQLLNNKHQLKSSTKSSDVQAEVLANNSRASNSDLNSALDKSLKNNSNFSETGIANNLDNKKNSEIPELKSNEEIKQLLDSKTTKDAVANNQSNEMLEGKNNEENNPDTISEDTKGQDIEEAIAEADNTDEKEKQLRRWSIAPNVAPVYFSSLGDGSSIDPLFNTNNTTSDINMSYGIKGSYALNERLKITLGVNRVSLNNTTNDVIALTDNSFSSLATTGRFENIDLKNNLSHQSLALISRANLNSSTVPESIKTIKAGNIDQRFGFIEIPLEVEYRLIDKKVGVNVSSGFSTLFLNENEILADVNGEQTSIGEANNINNTSFSANFGIGVDYNITDKLNINLGPKVKYQLNTFTNTSGEFRPFFIGVYTGLNFKF